jgi:hypothetical protein
MDLRAEIMELSRRHKDSKAASDPDRERASRVRKTGERIRVSCERKETYTYDMALLVVRRIKRNQGAIVQPYKCHFCGNWHVGSSIRSQT